MKDSNALNIPALIPRPKNITLTGKTAPADAAVTEQTAPDLAGEAYRLLVTPESILIAAASPAGFARAKSTLEQLRFSYRDRIPCMEISDAPEKPYRSFHIDCARHFIPVEELKKIISMASLFKLNKFHWHFSDDQGWRIESRAFPLLHQTGARRRGDHCGSYVSDDEEWHYYTRDEVKDLVAFCGNLGIEIVPEVDLPGHVSAILAAYPMLSCHGNPVEVQTKSGIFRDILCPGKEETFAFLEELLSDLLELFPGDYFHIGGDEAPKGQWETCPHCRGRMEEEHLTDLRQLQGYFNNRVAAFLKARGKTVIAWNEAARGGNLDPDIVLQLWNDGKAPGSGEIHTTGKEHLARGGRVIMSTMMNAYCDYPYAFIPLKKTYGLSLVPYGMESLTPEEEGRVLGTECLLWTEYIRDWDKLERLAWPRFVSGAELGWCGGAPGEYGDFKRRLTALYPVFSAHGINAEKMSAWDPGPVEAARQLLEFKKNFPKDVLRDFKNSQESV